MSLNIKNEETVHLARELAEATGETVTAAVTEAVRERLERIRRERRDKGLVERLLAIAADTGPRFKGPYSSIDHGDLLYDEMGLPK
jgi:antitoxin VapB